MKIKYIVTLSLVTVFIPLSISSVQAQVFTKNLYFGMQGDAQVSQLQDFLTAQGLYNGPITGNFYFLTLNAVKAFQTKHGISPAAGYFGPLTMAAAEKIADADVNASNAQATSETGTTTPPTQTSNTTQLQLDALLKEVTLLQQQLAVQQQTNQTVQNLSSQVQQQAQTIQQIQQNTQAIQQNTTPTQSTTTTSTLTSNSTPTPTPVPTQTPSCTITATVKANASDNGSKYIDIEWTAPKPDNWGTDKVNWSTIDGHYMYLTKQGSYSMFGSDPSTASPSIVPTYAAQGYAGVVPPNNVAPSSSVDAIKLSIGPETCYTFFPASLETLDIGVTGTTTPPVGFKDKTQ